MTGLLDCDFCAVSEYDPSSRVIRMLADFDRSGQRRPDWEPYPVSRFPVTAQVRGEQRIEVVNVSDPRADAAMLSTLRRFGSKSIMLVPLVFQDRPIGLLGLVDLERERRYSRQELRICRTVASQAAVALNNAILFDRLRRRSTDVSQLCFAIEKVAAALPQLASQSTLAALLRETAAVSCEALAAISAVASCGGESAAAPRWPERTAGGAVTTRSDSDAANLLTTAADAGGRGLTISVALPAAPADGQSQLLTLICAAASTAADRLFRHLDA